MTPIKRNMFFLLFFTWILELMVNANFTGYKIFVKLTLNKTYAQTFYFY
jgi:hypothetical protein